MDDNERDADENLKKKKRTAPMVFVALIINL